MKIKSDNQCSFQCGSKETITHIIWECNVTQNLLSNFEEQLNQNYNNKIILPFGSLSQ